MNSSSLIRVLIADDEQPAREAIKEYLKINDSFVVVDECSDGVSALHSIQANAPDLVLLDIEMPELNGMELVRALKTLAPHIVFITAYHDYAVQAFEENAVDYLLKPLSRQRFNKMLEKVVDEMTKNDKVSLEVLVNSLQKFEHLHNDKYFRKISVKRKGKISFIPIEEIIWIESAGSFTKLHLEDTMEITNFSITELEKMLDPAQHIRIHKSNIINLDKIKSIESYFHGEYIITMTDDTNLKLSRGYKGKLEAIMNQYK